MKPTKTTVTLEDLLRMKRAERPAPEFWTRFEQEMHHKKLAAIVEPRPWWAPLIRVGARVSRYQLPLGAAAVLALSFITVREYRSTTLAPSLPQEVVASALPRTLAVESIAAPEMPAMPTPTPALAQIERSAAIEEAIAEDLPATGRSPHAVPLLDRAPAVLEPSPSARAIAANLEAARAVDPGIVDEVFGVMTRVEVRQRPRDPLAQMSMPGDARRSRLLAMALPAMAASEEVGMGSSDRVVRRLTEDRLYDTISRIGVQGDRVAIKF